MSAAKVIDGQKLSETMRAEIAARTTAFKEQTGVIPGLAVVIVGSDPASEVYVRMKGKAAETAGFYSHQTTLAADTTEAHLLAVISGLNAEKRVHGILVQLPLPPHIDKERVLSAVRIDKDVDGFHPVNAGRLAIGDTTVLAPCTPAGIIQMLLRSGYDPKGKHVVVVGRSTIVGRPVSHLLIMDTVGGNATVTIAHSRTRDLPAITRLADILIAAIGKPEFITADMVKPGAVVIDVGVNRVADPDSPKGYKLVGDVLFNDVASVAAAVSPVPGGVGPMTITMLLDNTLRAAQHIAHQARARPQ